MEDRFLRTRAASHPGRRVQGSSSTMSFQVDGRVNPGATEFQLSALVCFFSFVAGEWRRACS